MTISIEFVKTLSDNDLIRIMKDFSKFEDQGFLGDSYLWKATEDLMTMVGAKDPDGIQRTFWARVLHTEVCKNLSWRWVNDCCGEQ